MKTLQTVQCLLVLLLHLDPQASSARVPQLILEHEELQNSVLSPASSQILNGSSFQKIPVNLAITSAILPDGKVSYAHVSDQVPQPTQRQNKEVTRLKQFKVASKNLQLSYQQSDNVILAGGSRKEKQGYPSRGFVPGDRSPHFSLYTADGYLNFPNDSRFQNVSVVFVVFNNQSGYSSTMWTNRLSLQDFIFTAPQDSHFMFVSSSEFSAVADSLWMKEQLETALTVVVKAGNGHLRNFVNQKCSFVLTSLHQLGNCIPSLLQQWACGGHGCGLDQILFKSKNFWLPVILKRIDARYDWLPSPLSLGSASIPARVIIGDGCQPHQYIKVKGMVAIVAKGGCDFAQKISSMAALGAKAVLIMSQEGEPLQDMNCLNEKECSAAPNIPAASIPFSDFLFFASNLSVRFQNTPSPNLCFAIDKQRRLQECGWLLYPSMQFYAWQSQWLSYRYSLSQQLKELTAFQKPKKYVLNAFNFTVMEGHQGIVVNMKVPSINAMLNVSDAMLDMALSCPGYRDEDCPPWDHTIQLYVCCDEQSDLCGMELGRWISPFRRRVGRWLTDVTPLLPLLHSPSGQCQLTMKTVWWAKAWKPSLRIILSASPNSISPVRAYSLFRGGRFDSSYNKKYLPMFFYVPVNVAKVEIVSVITGHGSDENGCGEFCPTSHVFTVNGRTYNKTFTAAGTPLGCAQTVLSGSIPNEHGTWLYGRGGWCDGRQVDPWTVDVTKDLKSNQDERSVGRSLTINYSGLYEGKNPDPKRNPGDILMYSYVVYYARP